MEQKLEYDLRCEMRAHSKDVRAVCAGKSSAEEQDIYSGSRDKSTCIWSPIGNGYMNTLTFEDHTNFVSCVYYHKPTNWICTGSNDNTVCIYKHDGHLPFLRLTEHKDTVTSICAGLTPNSLVTGSWDKTAIVWTINESDGTATATMVLRAHTAAIWAVAVKQNRGEYVTGSADKNIIIWDKSGSKLQTLSKHTDCVRGLLVLPNDGLVSVGNDALIRYWDEQGNVVRELCGHTNYIYACAHNSSMGDFIVATCGEDSTLRVWNVLEGTELCEPVAHPAISVWSVACLENGDIITGASDGIVRIFTANTERKIDESSLVAYKASVAVLNEKKNEDIGGYKKSDLPGPEALYRSGREEGQCQMIRHDDNSVKCYSWTNGEWTLIGDVMGASGGTHGSSGKQLFEGKEYDFVFDVDISDGVPAIKLPYNLNEDPFEAAQKFLDKNNLPQDYLSQVAEFIIKNSTPKRTAGTVNSNESFYDPFTGSSRYLPGSSNSNVQAVGNGNSDPFTGSTSYTTSKHSKHFPIHEYVTFNICDSSKILQKLKEFNQKLAESNETVNESNLELVVTLAEPRPIVDPAALELINRLLHWPSDILFPVIDVLRLAVRSEAICTLLANNYRFVDLLMEQFSSSAPNQLMIVRCLANMMTHNAGRQQIEQHLSAIIIGTNAITTGNANMQLAISSFYLNASIWQLTVNDANACELVTQGIAKFLMWATEKEPCYRSMQAIGNLLTTKHKAIICALVVSADQVFERMQKLSAESQFGEYSKLTELVKALMETIQKI